MNILILGGDGFCGWPTSLRLAKEGHNILILDNLSRRKIDNELSSNSLTNIATINDRIKTAKEYVGNIDYKFCDIGNYKDLIHNIESFCPDSIVHFAEQRAAPYSMIGEKERRYTVDNNVSGTHNVLSAIVDTNADIHLIHLGTMGVYGYSKAFGKIPEGYLDIEIKQTSKETSILYPTQPGSVYHMTKSLDQIMFQFYNKNWGLRITDLHQGIVWGTQTNETKMHENLVNRFDYDGIYGTVLNRFLFQAAIGKPLSVYGTGGQTRAFIHIQDTARCIQLAIEKPHEDKSRVRILNQVAEALNLKNLALKIEKLYGSKIDYISNPRKELAENELEVENQGFLNLGFEPITLDDKLIEDVVFIAKQFKENFKPENILNSPRW